MRYFILIVLLFATAITASAETIIKSEIPIPVERETKLGHQYQPYAKLMHVCIDGESFALAITGQLESGAHVALQQIYTDRHATSSDAPAMPKRCR